MPKKLCEGLGVGWLPRSVVMPTRENYLKLKPLLVASALAAAGVAAHAATTILDPNALYLNAPTFTFAGQLDAFSVATPATLSGTLDFSAYVFGSGMNALVLADDSLTSLTVSLVNLNTNTVVTRSTGPFTDTFNFSFGAISSGSYKILYSGGNDWGTFLDAASYTVSAVPEPESYVLLLAGLGTLGFMAKRRKG